MIRLPTVALETRHGPASTDWLDGLPGLPGTAIALDS